MEPVGASDDQADFDVHALDRAVRDVLLDRVNDERPSVEHHDRVGWFDAAVEDGPELFFHFIRSPDAAAFAADGRELCLLAGEVGRVLQQTPAWSFERPRVLGVVEL